MIIYFVCANPIKLLIRGSDGFCSIIVPICLRFFMTSPPFAAVPCVRSKRACESLFLSKVRSWDIFEEIASISWFWSRLLRF